MDINTSTAGSVDIHATTTFTVAGVSLTRETDGQGNNSTNANKVYVDAYIVVSPLTATNEVNDAHQITATVYQDDGVAAPDGDNVDGFGFAPDGTTVTFSLLNNTAGADFVNDVNTCTTTGGSCSVFINTDTAGSVDIHATTTFDVGGESVTRETDGQGNNSVDANKVYVDAQIDLTPLTATNEVNSAHTITATVQQDDGLATGGDGVDGWAPAPDGTVVTFSLLNNTAGADFVGGVDTCTINNGLGTCSVDINTSTAGSVDIHATTTFTVAGVSLTRETDGQGNNSTNANKVYVDAYIIIGPDATNNVGEPHTFTVNVFQDDGLPAGAPGDAATGFGPVPDGTIVAVTLTNSGGADYQVSSDTCADPGTVVDLAHQQRRLRCDVHVADRRHGHRARFGHREHRRHRRQPRD